MKKSIECDCGWSVQADNEDELIAKAQEHAQSVHKMAASREQLLAMAKPA